MTSLYSQMKSYNVRFMIQVVSSRRDQTDKISGESSTLYIYRLMIESANFHPAKKYA